MKNFCDDNGLSVASTSSMAATNALLAFGGMTQHWRRWGESQSNAP
jgi:hypothetical protein